jgi:hypothetical protein
MRLGPYLYRDIEISMEKMKILPLQRAIEPQTFSHDNDRCTLFDNLSMPEQGRRNTVKNDRISTFEQQIRGYS